MPLNRLVPIVIGMQLGAFAGCDSTPSRLNDPDFGEMSFNGVSTWNSDVDFTFPQVGAGFLAVHVWTSEAGPSEAQRERFRELKTRYPDLWPTIGASITEVHPTLKSLEELTNWMSEWVTVHLGQHSEDSVELVYTLELPDEGNRSYRVALNGWDVGETTVTE